MTATTIGLDIAKQVFQVHGVDQQGKEVLCRRLRREQVAPCFANLSPCLVGLEAARALEQVPLGIWYKLLQEIARP